MITRVSALPDNTSFDLVVIGAGAGGMAAAAFGAIAGKRVLLVERTEYLGGTSALSAATVWAPGNSHATEVAPVDSTDADSFDKARTFLDSVVGNHAPASLRRAFLRSAPQAIATLEAGSQLRFRPYPTHPDYEQDHEGASMRGRARATSSSHSSGVSRLWR
jgi:succinate dehydrogenase/fumarate reductase flavoprotein subunit